MMLCFSFITRICLDEIFRSDNLTARWLDRLLRNNCPRSEVFQLLFAIFSGLLLLMIVEVADPNDDKS